VAKRDRTRMAYLLPFEIVSIHLLVVLVGAAYLARAKRRRGGAVT
jgi:NADH-quinone oxidoreductase subunit J